MAQPSRGIFIKLGGSLITDKTVPMSVRQEALTQVCKELAELYATNPDVCWFIGNGAGSFGHFMVQETGWREHPEDPVATARVREATGQLNQTVISTMVAAGLPALSMPPATWAAKVDDTITATTDTIFNWAQHRYVPVVYGDLIGYGVSSHLLSTEGCLEVLARAWMDEGHSVERVIYCTSVDGVLNAEGATIPVLTAEGMGEHIGEASGFDVSGGMRQKVEAGFTALQYCPDVYIINGTTYGQLTKAAAGEPAGTRLSTHE